MEGWCSTIELHPQMIGTDFFLCLVDCRASLTKRILQESRRKVNPFFKKIEKNFKILKKVKIQGKWRE